MFKRGAVLSLLALAFAGAALAKDVQLTASQVRAELVGVDLIGEIEGVDAAWRECIEPGGRTAYLRPEQAGEPRLDEGRLVISDGGQLCFSYASRGFADRSCFWARRGEAGNYRLVSVDDPGLVYATRIVRRGVRNCDPERPPTS
jgi:hypothetical protein